jgi:hypothetical protein
MNKHKKLIHTLSEDVQPVTPPKSLVMRVMQWLVPSLLCGLLGFFTLGFREEIFINMASMSFIVENTFIFISGICLATAAFISATPGYKPMPVVVLTCIALTLWFSILMCASTGTPSTVMLSEISGAKGMGCTLDIILLAIIPGIITFIMLKKSAATHLGWTGALAVLAIASLAALSSRFLCHNMDPIHLVIWHFLPVLFMGFIGIFLGKKLLKW